MKGFSGSFRKRNIIIYQLYGKTIARTFPTELHDKNSPPQKNQRNWLTEPNEIVRLLKPYAEFLYPLKGCSKRNSLHSFVMHDAMTKEESRWIIHYEKIYISNGNLHPLPELTITSLPDHQLKISWLNTAGKALASNNDNIVIVLYNPTSPRHPVIPATKEPVLRSQSSLTFSVPDYWYGHTILIYIYSISQTKKRISNTQFLTTAVP